MRERSMTQDSADGLWLVGVLLACSAASAAEPVGTFDSQQILNQASVALSVPGDKLWHVTWSPDGRWLAGTVWKPIPPVGRQRVRAEIIIWSGEDLKEWARLPVVPVGCMVHRLAFGPDSRWLSATTREQDLNLWKLEVVPRTRRQEWVLKTRVPLGEPLLDEASPRFDPEKPFNISCLSWSPDGRFIATSAQRRAHSNPGKNIGIVQVWDVEISKPDRTAGREAKLTLKQRHWLQKDVLVAAADFCGNREKYELVTLHGDGYVRKWASQTGTQLGEFAVHSKIAEGRLEHDHLFGSLACSQDGKMIAVAGGYGLARLDSANGKRLAYQEGALKWEQWAGRGHGGGAVWGGRCVAFAPQGRYLFVLDSGKLVIRSTSDLQSLASVDILPQTWWNMAFSPDGRRFATSGSDARVWDVDKLLQLTGVKR